MTHSDPSITSSNISNRLLELLAKGLIVGGTIAAVGGIIIFGWGHNSFDTHVTADAPLLGNLGSFLSGTVGVTWSLASVIFFYLALKEQRRDIKINQATLNLQIKEMEDTRKVYQDQADTIRVQGFENTFFQLVQLFSGTAKNIKERKHDGSSDTFNMFKLWADRLDAFSKGHLSPAMEDEDTGYPIPSKYEPFLNEHEFKAALDERYELAYNSYEDIFNHYFRQLYHILKYIHLSKLIPNDRKSFYASLVRAQLSQAELYSLVYNALMPGYGRPKFLFLMIEYDLVKNFNFSEIPSDIVWSYYNTLASEIVNPFL